jgi:hypothetical protein
VDGRSELTERDYEALARRYITREGADFAGFYRVDTHEGARLVGRVGGW